jgi:2'-5' RNA ligase
MRTFIAVPLPSECRDILERMQRPLRSLGADVRWTSIASIHLTLKFLGEVEPALVSRLVPALSSISAEPFALCIRGLGAFPNLHNPHVIWCGVEGDVQNLSALQSEVEAVCEGFGMAREQRMFHPHLTLGRVHGKRNLQPLMDYIRIGAGLESAFEAKGINIYRSVLTPRGAVYTVLESVNFMERR